MLFSNSLVAACNRALGALSHSTSCVLEMGSRSFIFQHHVPNSLEAACKGALGALSHCTSCMLEMRSRSSQFQVQGGEESRAWCGAGSEFGVVRYHSLQVDAASLPACLEPLAWTSGAHRALQTAVPDLVSHALDRANWRQEQDNMKGCCAGRWGCARRCFRFQQRPQECMAGSEYATSEQVCSVKQLVHMEAVPTWKH